MIHANSCGEKPGRFVRGSTKASFIQTVAIHLLNYLILLVSVSFVNANLHFISIICNYRPKIPENTSKAGELGRKIEMKGRAFPTAFGLKAPGVRPVCIFGRYREDSLMRNGIVNGKGLLSDPQMLRLLACSQFEPTAEKLARLVSRVQADESVFAFTHFHGGEPDGILLLREEGESSFVISSIAVAPNARGAGIGSGLLRAAATELGCRLIRAETDGDAVGFYRRCGFDVRSLGEKYPGCVRYACTLPLTSQ